MVKHTKQEKYENSQYEEEYKTEEDFSFDNQNHTKGGDREGLNNMPTIDKFLNPEDYLYRIKKSMLGFELVDDEWVRISEPWAPNKFINLYINALRSVLTQHNMWSSISADDAAFNILERLYEMIYNAVDYGVSYTHLETMINIFDNAMQLFYGIIIDGKGRENIKQVLTSVYQDMSQTQKGNERLINFDVLKKKI